MGGIAWQGAAQARMGVIIVGARVQRARWIDYSNAIAHHAVGWMAGRREVSIAHQVAHRNHLIEGWARRAIPEACK